MAKRLTGAEADAVLRGGDGRAINELLRALPEDVDPQLAAKPLVAGLLRHVWAFGRAYRRLPPPVIAAVVGLLETVTTPGAIFLRAYLSTGSTTDDWADALNVLLDLSTSYAWGSKQRRAKLHALAKDSRAVAAIQASLVGNDRAASLDAMAVLAIEGSDASADALMPHFERAARTQDLGLDRLQRLRTHASTTPAMVAMLARIDAMLAARNASSPALELALEIGLGSLERFWFSGLLSSVTPESRVPRFQCWITLDSRRHDWFRVSATQLASGRLSTVFDHQTLKEDTLALGRCSPSDLPPWLAASAKKLEIQWDFDAFGGTSNVRGKKRAQAFDWLRGVGAARGG